MSRLGQTVTPFHATSSLEQAISGRVPTDKDVPVCTHVKEATLVNDLPDANGHLQH